MGRFIANKTKPYIYSGKHQAMGEFDETYWYKANLMTRKFKGKEIATYTGNRQVAVVGTKPVDRQEVTERLNKEAGKCVKAGRFHDWTWQPKPDRDVAIFAPTPIKATHEQ